jgi:serine/threonine protein kinase
MPILKLLGGQVGKMTAVNHPCIVRCYGMLEPTPGIVLELVEGGSLFQIIHFERDEPFTSSVLPLTLSICLMIDVSTHPVPTSCCSMHARSPTWQSIIQTD